MTDPSEVLQAKGFILPPQVDHDVEMEESMMPPMLEGESDMSSVSGPAMQKRRATARKSTSIHCKPFIKEESKSAIEVSLLYDVEAWAAKESELKVRILLQPWPWATVISLAALMYWLCRSNWSKLALTRRKSPRS